MWSGEEPEIHFGKSREEITVFLQKPMALRVPILLCHLIAKGAWRAIVLNGGYFGKTGAQEPLHLSFQKTLGGFPPAEWVDHAVADQKRKCSEEEATELRFRSTEACIFFCVLAAVEFCCKPLMRCAKSCSFLLEEKVMLRLDSFAGNNKRLSRSDFGPEQLLHALCAAMGVPDRSNSAEIFRHLAKYVVRPWRRPKNTIACRDQPRADSAFLLPCAGFGRRDLRLGWKTQMYIFQSCIF